MYRKKTPPRRLDGWTCFATRLLVFTSALTLASPSLATGMSLDAEIRAIIHDRGLEGPGCAISVLKEGKPFQTIFEGAADIAGRKAIDADTQFYMASIAKQFTALAVAQLVIARKIDLDADIQTYIPEMPRYGAPVTVAMLLHHTAGIRDMLTLGAYAGYRQSSDVTREEALRLIYAQPDTVFPPGSQHRYSNSGYLLLSEIVARASGISFPDYMKAHIFAPLGMSRTSILTGSRTSDTNAAHGYARDGAGFHLADTHPLYGGAGGAIVTLRDLAKYDHDIQIGHKIWTSAVSKIMLKPGELADGTLASSRGVVYAAGLGLNGPWIQHGGAGEGFKNMLAWLPAGRLSVHVLCNNGANDPAKIAARIVDALRAYPTLRATIPPIAGRYSTANLPVTYTLRPNGDATLAVEIKPFKEGLGRQRTVVLSRGPDGAFTGDGIRILADEDGAGFSLGDIRSRAGLLHFRRLP